MSFEQRDFGKRFWKLAHGFIESEKLSLSMTETVSLFLSQQLLSPLAGTQFGDGLATALQKVRSLLPRKVLGYFSDLDQTRASGHEKTPVNTGVSMRELGLEPRTYALKGRCSAN